MIKIGIVGFDESTAAHLKVIRSLPQYSLVGINASRSYELQQFCHKHNIRIFSDFNNLLHDSDVIDLFSTSDGFVISATNVIKKSKHLFLEKPFLAAPDDILKLIRLSDEAGVKVKINYPERYNPVYRAITQHINNPLYIEAQHHIAFLEQNQTISVVNEYMLHDIDIILSVVNANLRNVHATGVNVFNGSPDIVNVRLEFDNGAVASLTANRIATKNIKRLKFYQHHARIQADFFNKKIKILIREEKKNKNILQNFATQQPNNLSQAFNEFYKQIIQSERCSSLNDTYQNLSVIRQINERIEMLSP